MHPHEYRWQTHPQYFQQQNTPAYTGSPSFNGYYPHQGWQQHYSQGTFPAHPHQQSGYPGQPPQPYGGYYHGYYPGQQVKNVGLLAAFQTKDGKFDYNKAFVAMDQVMKTANQIGPFMKQVGSLFTMLSP
ncbi:YppG family protein [Alteribacter natronophilus]|uniref:YppG family protein n=1 Tax=Alteribacter natronophilus TaxID=2583810 RepID=UPI00110ECD7C|nr:YppG family protein [Alteribacter natronophilus]TMW73005.1 hypothetical protein FGB90_01470 [Alteribacter natronophilus]